MAANSSGNKTGASNGNTSSGSKTGTTTGTSTGTTSGSKTGTTSGTTTGSATGTSTGTTSGTTTGSTGTTSGTTTGSTGGTTTGSTGGTTTGTTTGTATSGVQPKQASSYLWIDPRMSNSSMLAGAQWYGGMSMMSNVPEAGWVGPDGQMRFGKVADPLDPTKKAFRVTVNSTDPGDQWGSQRVEMYTGADSQFIPPGKDFWVLWAYKLPNLANTTDAALIMQLHWLPNSNDEPGPPPFAVYQGGNEIAIASRYNAVNPIRQANRVDADVFTEPNTDTTQWQFYAMKVRLGWSAAQNPYMKIYRAVGGGAMKLIVDRSTPNTYNTPGGNFAKAGLYKWDHTFGSVASRTIYHKGLFVIPDDGSYTPDAMIAFLRGI